MVRAGELGELGVRDEPAPEVGAQREHDRGSTVRVPGRLDERLDERAALAFRYRRREHLLELVDGEDEPLAGLEACEGARQLVADSARELGEGVIAGPDEDVTCLGQARQKPGAQERRLADPGRAADQEELRLAEPGQELVDKPLAAEEELARRPPRTARGP